MARQTAEALKFHANSTEILAGSYDVLSSGFSKISDVQNIMANSVKAAVGGFSDVAMVSDALTSILNSYKLKAEDATKVTDQMLQTQNLGKIVIAEYAAQIGRVAPVASNAGVTLEELNAAISTSTAQGLPAESAFSGMWAAISNIIAPSKKQPTCPISWGLNLMPQP